MALPDTEREPLISYEQAVWRLVYAACRGEFIMAREGPVPLPASLVGDIFWVRDEKVRRDFFKYFSEVA